MWKTINAAVTQSSVVMIASLESLEMSGNSTDVREKANKTIYEGTVSQMEIRAIEHITSQSIKMRAWLSKSFSE